MLVSLDGRGWTQDQRNMTPARAVALLAAAGVPITRAPRWSVPYTELDVPNTSGDPSAVLTQAAMEADYATWRAAQDVADAAEAQAQADREAALVPAWARGKTRAQLEAEFDADNAAITNITTARNFNAKWGKRMFQVLWGVVR